MTGLVSKCLMATSREIPLSRQDRRELVKFLVEEDYDYIMTSGEAGEQFLRDVLLLGHKGFCDYRDKELAIEAHQYDIMKAPE